MTSTNSTLQRTSRRSRGLLAAGLWVGIAMLAGSTALAQEGSLYVVEGRVGIGTESPTTSLEVRGSGGSTALLIDENSSSSQIRNLFTIENNGPARMLFKDTDIDKSWRLGTYFGNTFRFDTPSGGGIELELDKDGNMNLKGSLSQSSSRTLKQDFLELDPVDVLQRVAKLPVSEWSYIHDSTGARHVGPMAEDFRASFELGQSSKQLAPSDTAGVALVAIQGLNSVVQSDRAGLEELRQENLELKTKLDAMQDLQQQLLRRLEALEGR